MSPIAYRINLPCPPRAIVEQAMCCQNDINLEPVANKANKFDDSYTKRSVRLNGRTHVTRYQRKYVIPGWQQWCVNEIDPRCYHSGVAVNDGPSAYHGPHADAGRTWAVYYMIETGGSRVTTSWWKHPEHPLILSEDLYPQAAWDYDDLELVCSEIFQTGHWYLFHARVLHSVEHVVRRRISLQTNLHSISALLNKLEIIG